MGVENPKAWVLVPVEPTPAMVAAWMCDHRNWSDRYAAMLSAYPALPVDGGEVVATSWKYHDRVCVDFKFAPDPYALERGFLTDIEPLVRQSALLAAESRALSLEEEVKAAALHVEQLSELLKIIKEYWIDYDHIFSISVHEADTWLSGRQALSEGEQT